MKEQTEGKHHLEVYGVVYAVLVAGFFLDYSVNVFVARHLNPSEYGNFGFALGIVQIVATLALLGGGDALPRFIPIFIREEKWSHFKGYILHNFKVLFIFSAIVIFLTELIYMNYLSIVEKDFLVVRNHHPASCMMFLLPFLGLSFLFIRTIQCLGMQQISRIPDTIVRPLLVITCMTLFIKSGVLLHNHHVFLGFVFAMTSIIVIQTLLIARRIPRSVFKMKAHYEVKTWTSVSLTLMLSAFIFSALTQVELIALEVLPRPEEEVGVFAAMSTIYLSVVLVNQAVRAVIAPLISPLVCAHDGTELQKLYNSAFSMEYIINLVICGIIVLFGKGLLYHFGPLYVPAYPLLVLLVVSGALLTPLHIGSQFLSLCGEERKVMSINLSGLASTIVMSTILISCIGLAGAVLSLLIARAVMGVQTLLYVKKTMNLRPLIVY